MTLDERIDGAAGMMVRMRQGGESGVENTRHMAETIAKTEFRREGVDAAALEFDEIFNAKVDRIYDEITRRAAALHPELFQELRLERLYQDR